MSGVAAQPGCEFRLDGTTGVPPGEVGEDALGQAGFAADAERHLPRVLRAAGGGRCRMPGPLVIPGRWARRFRSVLAGPDSRAILALHALDRLGIDHDITV
jgi:hypothetical protein